MDTGTHRAAAPCGFSGILEMGMKIDLHMHTTVSDGTDTPEQLLQCVKRAGITLFSVTDHDAVKGVKAVQNVRKEEDPLFLAGAEFSCRDEEGRYHILGYGFDPDADSIRKLVETAHAYRMRKVLSRLEGLREQFQIRFPEEEISALLALDNPGKPHIGNLMVRYRFAKTREEAITGFLDQLHVRKEYLRPEEAITAIRDAGGTAVLAHPAFGSGNQLITGERMDCRIRRLKDLGLQGMEAFYSGFAEKLRAEMLFFAEKYGLYVTAGSDYHGANKSILPGKTGLDGDDVMPDGMRRFLNDMGCI